MTSKHSNYAIIAIGLAVGLTLSFSLVGVVKAQEANSTTSAEVDDQSGVEGDGSSVGDMDEDGHADAAIREGGKTIDAGTAPENQQGTTNGPTDTDEDGRGDVMRTEPDYLDEDSDDDSIERDTPNGDKVQRILIKKLPGVSFGGDEDSDDDGIDDGEARRPGDPIPDIDITVRAAQVRGWDVQTKEEVRERLAELADEIVADNPQLQTERFGLYTAVIALDNEHIDSIETDTDEETGTTQVLVEYRTNLSIFGLFPREITATSRTTRDRAGNITLSEVTYDAPWYRRWFSRDSQKEATARLVSDIHTKRIAIEEEGVPAVNERPAPKR